LPLDKLSKELVGQKISVGGVILKIHKILTKNQQTMYFIVLADVKGSIELLVFPKVLERIASLWEEEKVILATGRLSDKDGEYKLIVDEAKEINQSEMENHLRIEATKSKHQKNESAHEENHSDSYKPKTTNQKLIITLPDDAKPEIIHKLSELFRSCPRGKCKVFLHHQTNKLETPFSIGSDQSILKNIKTINPDGKVELC